MTPYHTFFLQADLQNFAGRGFENMTLQAGVWTLQAGLWPACKVTCKKTTWWPEGPPIGVVAAPKALLLTTFFGGSAEGAAATSIPATTSCVDVRTVLTRQSGHAFVLLCFLFLCIFY